MPEPAPAPPPSPVVPQWPPAARRPGCQPARPQRLGDRGARVAALLRNAGGARCQVHMLPALPPPTLRPCRLSSLAARVPTLSRSATSRPLTDPPGLGPRSTSRAALLLCELESRTDRLWASLCCSTAPRLGPGRASGRRTRQPQGLSSKGGSRVRRSGQTSLPAWSSLAWPRPTGHGQADPQGLPPHPHPGRREEAATEEGATSATTHSSPDPWERHLSALSARGIRPMAPQDVGPPGCAPTTLAPGGSPLRFPLGSTSPGGHGRPDATGPCPSCSPQSPVVGQAGTCSGRGAATAPTPRGAGPPSPEGTPSASSCPARRPVGPCHPASVSTAASREWCLLASVGAPSRPGGPSPAGQALASPSVGPCGLRAVDVAGGRHTLMLEVPCPHPHSTRATPRTAAPPTAP